MQVFLLVAILTSIWNSSSAQNLSCPLSLLIPFHDDRILASVNPDSIQFPSVVSDAQHEQDGVGLLAMAFMALQDFNRRESTLVPKVSQYRECEIFYPEALTLVDTGRNEDLVSQTEDLWLTESTCALIGPVNNHVAETVASELVGSVVPATTFGAQAPRLTNGNLFPNLLVGYVDWGDVAMKVGQYMAAQQLNNMGVLYTPGDNLDFDHYTDVWEAVVDEYGLSIGLSLIWDRSSDEFEARLKALKKRDARAVVVALERDDNIDILAEVADNLGMLSDRYVWILMDSFVSPQHIGSFNAYLNSSLGKLLERSRLFQLLDGLVPVPVSNEMMRSNVTQVADRFQEEWQSRGITIINQLDSLLEQANTATKESNITITQDVFSESGPPYGSGYLYDAIMSMGMSACDGISPLNLVHEGPSGVYRYANRSLDPEGLTFGVFWVTADVSNSSYQAVLAEVTTSGDWETIPPNSAERKDNYDPTWAVILSLILGSFAVCFSIGSGFFVYYYRKNRIVSVAQPEFLYVACSGAMVMSFGSLLLGFDESSGWGQKGLDAKCIVMTWCDYVGSLIVYMALFSKLWRVQRVTQMRRRQKVEVKHVIGPFIAIITISIGLLFVYTFVQPPLWIREPLWNNDFNSNTVGRCEEQLWFELPLDILITVAVAISAWQAWKTRTLPEDISDAKRVWQTLTAHLVLLFVGFALILVASLYENGAFFFLSVLLISFFFSVSSVAFLVVPKMYYIRRFNKTGELPAGLQRGRTRVSGINLPTGTPTPTGTGSRTGPSSHITFNRGQNPSSMVPSGISGTSGVSSNSHSESGNRSLSRFGSFRLSRASQNRSAREISGTSPKPPSRAPVRPSQRPDNGSLSQSSQTSPRVFNAYAINHTGIPAPPISISPQNATNDSRSRAVEATSLSHNGPRTDPMDPTESIPAPPITSYPSAPEDRFTPTTINEATPALCGAQNAIGPSLDGGNDNVGINDSGEKEKTLEKKPVHGGGKKVADLEEKKRDELESRITKNLRENVEESTETVNA